MPKVVLTDRFCSGAKSAASARTDYFDEKTPGMALRVSPTGNKAWSFHFTSPKDGRRARVALGSYPSTSLADARTLATEARGHLGEIPARDPRDVFSGAEASAMTVAMLVSRYLEKRVAGRLRSAKEIERRFAQDVLPLIGAVRLADVHKRDINRVIDRILKRDSQVQANRTFETMRAMWRWAVGRGDMDRNPMEGMAKPAAESSRDRVLSDDEIRAFWRGLPGAIPNSPTVQRILKLCLLTGQRVGEVAGMTRDELDLERCVWSLPGSRTKNAVAHPVPLSELAIEIITGALGDLDKKSACLFPTNARAIGRQHIDAHAVAKTAKLAQAPAKDHPNGRFGIPRWTPHDLRRTALTGLAKLGVAPITIGAVANHLSVTKASITFAVYVKHDYAAEKRAALDLWADRLKAIVGDAPIAAEVIPMQRKKAAVP